MRRVMRPVAAALLAAVILPLGASDPARGEEGEGPSRLELTSAEHHVKKLEQYADRMKGRPFDPKRYGKPAMERVKALVDKYPDHPKVKALVDKYPDHPKVKELFERVRALVKRSKGDFTEITPEMLAYRKQESALVEKIGVLAREAWDAYLARFRDSERLLERPFPAPEPGLTQSEGSMFMRKVVFEAFAYPENEFTNTGRQFAYVGSPTEGFYFVLLSGRH